MNYLQALALLHNIVAPRNYLEIGCQYGHSLAISRCPSIAVDPAFQITEAIVAPTRFFRMTSDEFFATPAVQDAIGRTIDLAFIDGMHLAEFALRDFANIERFASERAVVAFDDVLPPDMESASRERRQKVWTGDVYRAALVLKDKRPDLDVRIYGIEQKGICIVSNLNPASGFREAMPEIERRLANGEWARGSTDEIRDELQPRDATRLSPELHELMGKHNAAKSLRPQDVERAVWQDLMRFGESPVSQDLLAKVKLLTSERDELVASVRRRNVELDRARQEARELRGSLRRAERERSALLGSASWRMMKPYRAARRLAGRVYHAAFGPKFLRDPVEHDNAEQARAGTGVPASAGVKRDASVIRSSGLFDERYYRNAFHGHVSNDQDPIEHYCQVGWKHRIAPTVWFNPDAYLQANPKVNIGKLNPLAHYIEAMTQERARREASARTDSPGRIAVYTAITGAYDELSEPLIAPKGVDFFVFTDTAVPDGSLWKQLDFDYFHKDPVRTARFVKAHPHLYFSDYDWSIWIDGNLSLNEDPTRLVERVAAGVEFATWIHPLRSCIYDEAIECIRRQKDDPAEIKEQVERYRVQDYPEKAGLYETSVLIRKHSSASVRNAMHFWWKEVDNGSKRDQLSLPVALSRHGVVVDQIASPGICMRTDHRFVYSAHRRATPATGR